MNYKDKLRSMAKACLINKVNNFDMNLSNLMHKISCSICVKSFDVTFQPEND